MPNNYKAALARFEQAVRQHALRGSYLPNHWRDIDREYEESKQALVHKLQYRQLAAEQKQH